MILLMMSGYERLRARFFKKIQDWILQLEGIRKRILRFFTGQINPDQSFGLWRVKRAEESTLEVDSLVPLTYSFDLGLILIRNSTQTAVTNMTIKQMLENKII